jgi:2,5-dihydroxypyridine 5,6-dioxygenase
MRGEELSLYRLEALRSIRKILSLCELRPNDILAIYTDTGKSPSIVEGFYGAALALDIEPLMLMMPHPHKMLQEPSKPALLAMKAATMVADLSTEQWLYTNGLNEILDSGSRVLQVLSTEHTIVKMTPTEALIHRAERAADLFTKAKEIRITSDSGTNVVANCEGRRGTGQDGIVRKPGDWDSTPSSIFCVAPIEGSVEGTLVLEPGDFMWTTPQEILVSDRTTITIKNGRATAIEGGADATRMEKWLASFGDPNSYVVAHTGFGGDPRASIDQAQEVESIEGCINIALGANIARLLGGKNKAKSHLDLMMMKQSMFADEECLVRDGKIVHPDLAIEPIA